MFVTASVMPDEDTVVAVVKRCEVASQADLADSQDDTVPDDTMMQESLPSEPLSTYRVQPFGHVRSISHTYADVAVAGKSASLPPYPPPITQTSSL